MLVTANIVGGLGNQLFQIANVLSYCFEFNHKPFFIYSEKSESVFKSRDTYWNTFLTRLRPSLLLNMPKNFKVMRYMEKQEDKRYFPIKNVVFNNKDYENKFILMMVGYFQTSKYFNLIRNNLINIFQPVEIEKQFIQNKYQTQLKKDNNTNICIHVRRGDYLKLSHVHTNLKLDYYKSSIERMDNELDNKINKTYWIFSDDIEYCKTEFTSYKFPGKEFIFITEKDYLELYLMSLLEHFIIANSSFSWWGSYLSKNDNKIIIAPKQWFVNNSQNNYNSDIYLENTICL